MPHYADDHFKVVIQSDWLDGTDSVLICLVTTTIREAPLYRFSLIPNEKNGLQAASQVMLDKIVAVHRDKCGSVIGRLDDEALISLSRMLAAGGGDCGLGGVIEENGGLFLIVAIVPQKPPLKKWHIL